MRLICFLVTCISLIVNAKSDNIPPPQAIEPNVAPIPPLSKIAAKSILNVGNACNCPGAVDRVKNNLCYLTLQMAIQEAIPTSKIVFGGTKYIEEPIVFTTNFSLKGTICNKQPATLIARMNYPAGGILMPIADSHELNLKDIKFIRDIHSGYASALRAAPISRKKDTGLLSIKILNCTFQNFVTKSTGGSAIFIPVGNKIYIDKYTWFENNVVDTYGNWSLSDGWIYGGGGALYIQQMWENAKTVIYSNFMNNHHKFQHGLGGAIKLDWVAGRLIIDGNFINNSASDGGAISIDIVTSHGRAKITGRYIGNNAIDYGLGSRGGAIRPEFVKGNMSIDGHFENNHADGRGGCFAINREKLSGRLTISGTYINNSAVEAGGVLSISNEASGYLNILPSTVFVNNNASSNNTDILYINPLQVGLSEMDWNLTRKFTMSPTTY